MFQLPSTIDCKHFFAVTNTQPRGDYQASGFPSYGMSNLSGKKREGSFGPGLEVLEGSWENILNPALHASTCVPLSNLFFNLPLSLIPSKWASSNFDLASWLALCW